MAAAGERLYREVRPRIEQEFRRLAERYGR
jgi:hypothetical protein